MRSAEPSTFSSASGRRSPSAATVALPAYARTLGTAERLSVGVIGCGGQGSGLLKRFKAIADVAYVCDPDEARRGESEGQLWRETRRERSSPRAGRLVGRRGRRCHA